MIVILLSKKIQEYMYVYRKNSYQKFDQKLKKTRYYYCNRFLNILTLIFQTVFTSNLEVSSLFSLMVFISKKIIKFNTI